MRANVSGRSSCTFCSGPDPSEVVTDTPGGLRAIASYGAFVPGWTIVVPPAHVPSTTALSREAGREFANFRSDVGALIESRLGPYVMFEHGAADFSRPAGCGVDHAHVHMVPLDIDLRRAIADLEEPDLDLAWERVDGLPVHRPGSDYIWVCDSTGAWIAYTYSQPSQVVRRALARHLGVDQWDWKADLRLEMIALTTQLLAEQQLGASA